MAGKVFVPGEKLRAVDVNNLVSKLGGQTVTAGTATEVPLGVRAASGQTANLFEVRNSGGTAIAGFKANGALINDDYTLISTTALSGYGFGNDLILTMGSYGEFYLFLTGVTTGSGSAANILATWNATPTSANHKVVELTGFSTGGVQGTNGASTATTIGKTGNASNPAAAHTRIFNCRGTGVKPFTSSASGYNPATSASIYFRTDGIFDSTDLVTSVRITGQGIGTQFTGGTLYLYGRP